MPSFPLRGSRLPASLHALALSCALLLAGCGNDSDTAPKTSGTPAGSTPPVATAPDYWPTTAWQTATPEAHGFSTGSLSSLASDAETALPYYTSLLVIKDGYIVHESYHDTATDTGNAKHQLWSVTKSVTSMTVGRALTRGELNIPAGITGKTDVLDLTVADVFPAAVVATLPAGDHRLDISLRNALEMRSGLAWNEGAWLLNTTAGKDPLLKYGLIPACASTGNAVLLCNILQRPLAYEPGSTWNYDTYTSYLISGFFTQLTGSSLNAYARDNLFTPLGITDFNTSSDWINLPAPYTFGGGLLSMHSRDLAKLGLLMQYKGKWDGEQLLSPQWLDTSLAIQGNGKRAAFDGSDEPTTAVDGLINYGMQWWRSTSTDMTGVESITAVGLYGQQMSIFRDKGLIILITCDSDGTDPRDRYAEINAFLKTHILDKLP